MKTQRYIRDKANFRTHKRLNEFSWVHRGLSLQVRIRIRFSHCNFGSTNHPTIRQIRDGLDSCSIFPNFSPTLSDSQPMPFGGKMLRGGESWRQFYHGIRRILLRMLYDRCPIKRTIIGRSSATCNGILSFPFTPHCYVACYLSYSHSHT